MEWVCEEVLPREVRKLAVAIEEKDKMIEEKDMQLALLSDDLVLEQGHARQLEYNNTPRRACSLETEIRRSLSRLTQG